MSDIDYLYILTGDTNIYMYMCISPSLNNYNLFGRFDVTEEFFTTAVRARIIDFILRRKKFKDTDDDDFAFGIEKMLNESTYEAAYPIHEVIIAGNG